MSSWDGFPASFYGEPGVLGLLSNAVSALLVLLLNFNTARTGVPPQGAENVLAGLHLILIGGACQLAAGLLSFRKYDHLSATAFVGYAALWASYGTTLICSGAAAAGQASSSETFSPAINATTSPSLMSHLPGGNLSSATPDTALKESCVSGLVPYVLLSVLLALCSATVNRIMPLAFGAIALTLAFEAAGMAATADSWALAAVSGVFELVVVAIAVYGSAALLVKGLTQRLAPLGGFGTPLFNVLLLGTPAARSANARSVRQEKKNTKYAEPAALGFFGDAVSPFIFAFYCFGYVQTFAVVVAWVSIVSAAQLFSSYYGHLRRDCYHATKFGLHAAYWLTKAWEEFVASVLIAEPIEVASGREPMVGDWFFVAAALALCALRLDADALELSHNASFLLLTVATIPSIPLQRYYTFFGVACSLFAAVSLYGTFCRLANAIAEKTLVPVGPQAVSTDRLEVALGCRRLEAGDQQGRTDSSQTVQIPDALFYSCNGVAALSALHAGVSGTNPSFLRLAVPWVLVSGSVVQTYVSLLQVRGGGGPVRFGPVLPSFYGAVWAVWTWFRLAGNLLQLSPETAYAFTAGAVAFLVINAFLMLIAAYRNLVLLFLTAVMEVLLVCFLLSTLQEVPWQLEMAMLAVFSIMCFYGLLASLTNCMFSQRLLPQGPPLLKNEKQHQRAAEGAGCPVADARLTSGLLRICRLLEDGGVCGIPTDTVYALAASCKRPQAIQHIYDIKERPAEKPICICISSVEQLVSATPPFSPLLWEFMRSVYPGGVSCVVSKGDWLLKLGVAAAYDRVGTGDSIMIRVPDHTVTCHLCDLTGPLAITSANPSGEPDSTHHSMVISRLGHKIQGVLCDGDSNEVVASTVVNCLKIDEGTITILREGCVPAAKVCQIFDRVKSRML